MNEPNRVEEKSEEKSREKQDEKSGEEKYRRDPLGAIVWALILIWAGLVLLADNLGYLDQIRGILPLGGPEWLDFLGVRTWGLIFLGAGVILLGEALFRVLVPAYRRSVVGTVILAFVFIGIGLGNLFSWALIWPLLLIAIGVVIVIGALTRRR